MLKLSLLILLTLIQLPVKCQTYDSIQKSGVTTVQGSIKDFNKYSEQFNRIEIQVPDWTNARRRAYFSNIDSTGNFSLSFFIFNTQEVVFLYKNKSMGIFVCAEDTLKLDIDADTFPSEIRFFGKTAKACLTLSTFRDVWVDSIFKVSNSKTNSQQRDSLSFEKYLDWRESVYKNELKILKSFLNIIQSEYPLDQYYTSIVQLGYYWDLLRYKSFRKTIGDNETINPIILINALTIDTLKYDIRISAFYPSVVNMLYVKVADLSNILYNKDHPIILPNPQSRTENKVLKRPTSEQFNKDVEQLEKEEFPYYIRASSAVKNDYLRESVLAHYYTNVLEYQNIDLGLDSILTYIYNPDIKASLINFHNSYNYRKTNQNSLKVKTNLINELTSKYKGYVLYIDFWGTWCGPCYDSFKNISLIKNAFENQKLAFIYLCCHCNEEKWKSDIKQYSLDGEHIFLDSEQFESLSKDFNIIGVPQFVIIDKNGKIVNDHAPRPSSNSFMQDKLINELKSYLK